MTNTEQARRVPLSDHYLDNNKQHNVTSCVFGRDSKFPVYFQMCSPKTKKSATKTVFNQPTKFEIRLTCLCISIIYFVKKKKYQGIN